MSRANSIHVRLRRPCCLLFLTLLVPAGCGGKKTSPRADASETAEPDRPPDAARVWRDPLLPVPPRVSYQLTPQKTLQTTRLDKKLARERLGELALAAAKEISAMTIPGARARFLALLCQRVGPDVSAEVVDKLAQAAFVATGKVTRLTKLQNPYDHLAQCLAHAGAATRARLLPAMLTRAATAKDLSVFSWPFNSARPALAKLTPAQVKPILDQARRLLARAKTYYHKEHLLAGLAAAGTVLPPAQAQALLARAERGVAGVAHKESRQVFLGELANTWVTLARHHPALLPRIARAIARLAATPYGRARALGALVALPTFPGSKQAPAVLKQLRGEAAKLPATEKRYLLERLIAAAARTKGALALLDQLVKDADPDQAVRAHVTAVKALATERPKEAIKYAGTALTLLDKRTKEARRNWGQAPLFRALKPVEQKVRQPLLKRIEQRAAGFKSKYYTAWTLRKLIELQRSNPEAVQRLAKKMMTAVAAIPTAARRVRALGFVYRLQLESGPAAAGKALDMALALAQGGASAYVWERLIQNVSKRPKAEQKRWLPRLLEILVSQSTTWRPRRLASKARLVVRLAPGVMPPSAAEALLLKVWQAVENAGERSSGVELRHVVNAMRAVGTGLARLGSAHFPLLVRRMEARIPRKKAWSEHMMSYVASLGTLLPPDHAAQLQKRQERWVAAGSKETRLMRRGAIIAGLVASHGSLNHAAIKAWLAKGKARLSWKPMVQFLIRLPLVDLQKKTAALTSRRERLRMYRALIRATARRAKREPRRRRRRRRRRGRRRRPNR